MSNKPNIDEILTLAALLALMEGKRPGKGGDKSAPYSFTVPLSDLLRPRESWADASPEVKARALEAIKRGDLTPNCLDPECDFCQWVAQQIEQLHQQDCQKGGDCHAHNADNVFNYAGAEAIPIKDVPGILREAADTYESRNPIYGDAYKHYGATMMGFFPQGLYINEPEDWNRFGLFSMMVSKMTRIAANLTTGGHRDSSLDLSVYAAMMTELTENK